MRIEEFQADQRALLSRLTKDLKVSCSQVATDSQPQANPTEYSEREILSVFDDIVLSPCTEKSDFEDYSSGA